MGLTRLSRSGAAITARALRVSAEVLELAARLVEDVVGLEHGDRRHQAEDPAVSPGEGLRASVTEFVNEAPRQAQPAVPQPEGLLADRHVEEEEVVLVGESADPGAEDGAGAQLRIAEPWEGYRAMRAADIVDRLVVESEKALSIVLLYERSTKNRRTVMAEAERELARRAAASG